MFHMERVEQKQNQYVPLCCSCHAEPARPSQRNGLKCHAAAQRAYRQRLRHDAEIYRSALRGREFRKLANFLNLQGNSDA